MSLVRVPQQHAVVANPDILALALVLPPPTQVRAGLAELGLRSLDELVGHADYLQQRDTPLAKTGEWRKGRL